MPTCGHCNYHEDTRRDKSGHHEVFCLIFLKWFNSSHGCKHFVEYSHGMTKELRTQLAIEKRREIENKKRTKEEWIIRIVIAIFTGIIGFIIAWVTKGC